jgi:hypothetical protein
MRRRLRDPLVHFLAVGAGLFALHASMADRAPAPDAAEIVVSRGRIESLAETFARQWHRAPSDDELAGLVRDFVREEALAREAAALGLDRDDTIVRRRLAQKMEFVSDDLAAAIAPGEDELRRFFADHPERFATEPRYTFTHVLLDRGRRGAALEADAAALLASLNAAGAATDVDALGDGRVLPARFADVARHAVEAQLGADFAARLDALVPGRFVWPVESAFGPHLVRLEARIPGRLPPFDEARDAVAREWFAAKRREVREAQLEALLGRYRVTMERPIPARVADAQP